MTDSEDYIIVDDSIFEEIFEEIDKYFDEKIKELEEKEKLEN